jgi:chromosomal replication initiation ATPase DnaA
MKQIVINVPEGVRYINMNFQIVNDKLVPIDDVEAVSKHFIDVILEYHNIDLVIIRNQSRKGEVVRARQQLCLLLKNNTKLTTTQIGNIINKDHSTVSTSTTTAMNRIETKNQPFLDEWNEIQNILNSFKYENH